MAVHASVENGDPHFAAGAVAASAGSPAAATAARRNAIASIECTVVAAIPGKNRYAPLTATNWRIKAASTAAIQRIPDVRINTRPPATESQQFAVRTPTAPVTGTISSLLSPVKGTPTAPSEQPVKSAIPAGDAIINTS